MPDDASRANPHPSGGGAPSPALGTGAPPATGAYAGSRFGEVRAQLLSDPYTTLPDTPATIGSMIKGCKNLLFRDAQWLLARDDDMVPPFPKLLNPTGICHFGRWRITEDTGYTGCLRGGTDHLIIVRCSLNFGGNPKPGGLRGFGLAGKIFPTLDPAERVKTANFITIDNLGGTHAEHFTDVALTNDPPLGPSLGLIPLVGVIANVVWVFNVVDQPPKYRPIYALAEQGLAPGEAPKGPHWLQLTTQEGIGKSDARDIREELRVRNYRDGRLRFDISVAERAQKIPPTGDPRWRRIGSIDLDEDVCSASGDHRLRFRHYPNRGHAST